MLGTLGPKNRLDHPLSALAVGIERIGLKRQPGWTVQTINVDGPYRQKKTGFTYPSPQTPAFVVLGTWPVVLMFRDYSRALGLVGLSRLRLVRLPFGMPVHVPCV